MPLSHVEKCVIQVLLNHGIIEDLKLTGFISEITREYFKTLESGRDQNVDSIDKESLFQNINKNIRKFGMEVKSIIERDGEKLVYHHGVVNTEEDFIAKTFGAGHFDQTEIDFFNKLAIKLVQVGKHSTRDIEQSDARPMKWSDSDVGVVLGKLSEKRWLDRDDRNYWVLGLRAFLELRRFIEGIMSEGDDAHDGKDLPQIIVY